MKTGVHGIIFVACEPITFLNGRVASTFLDASALSMYKMPSAECVRGRPTVIGVLSNHTGIASQFSL